MSVKVIIVTHSNHNLQTYRTLEIFNKEFLCITHTIEHKYKLTAITIHKRTEHSKSLTKNFCILHMQCVCVCVCVVFHCTYSTQKSFVIEQTQQG